MKIKLIVALLLALLTFLFITQNTEVVRVAFGPWSLELSLVLLLFVSLGVGVLLGLLLSSYLRYAVQQKRGGSRQRKVRAGAENTVDVCDEMATNQPAEQAGQPEKEGRHQQ
jgi:uncharacterized integral membrane protein